MNWLGIALVMRLQCSFNYLVSEREQRRRDIEAERLCDLEIEHELDSIGTNDRQVGRLLALENPARVYPDLAIGIDYAGSIAHQATGHDGLALAIARRQGIASRQRDQPFPARVQECASTDE